MKSKLYYLNFIILQWFFIRLARVCKEENGKWVQTGWTIFRYPIPLTGWWNNYKFIYKVKK